MAEQNGGMVAGRAVWNILGALALSVLAIVGAYWLIELLEPLMAGESGMIGGAVVVISIIGLFVVLFLVLLRIVPMWVRVGEKRFRG